MMIELEPSFYNRTGRRNDKLARGHETAHRVLQTNQMKVILLQVWAEGAVLGRAKTP